MKKFVLAIVIMFAFTSMGMADTATGAHPDTLSITKDILLSVPSTYELIMGSYKVLGDGAVYEVTDLGGEWDLGVLGGEPLADNPYGPGDRIGSTHYVDIRFTVKNNASGYYVSMNVSGEIFNLPESVGSTDGSILHFATFDIGLFEDFSTKDLGNLYFQESGAGSSSDGLYFVQEGIDMVLYDTGAGTILSDSFIALVFLNNVDPDFSNVDANGDGIVGSVTYQMVPYII